MPPTPNAFDEERVSAVILGTQSSPTHVFPGTSGEGMLVSLRALSEPELEVCWVQARLELRRLAAVNSWSEADVAALDPRFRRPTSKPCERGEQRRESASSEQHGARGLLRHPQCAGADGLAGALLAARAAFGGDAGGEEESAGEARAVA